MLDTPQQCDHRHLYRDFVRTVSKRTLWVRENENMKRYHRIKLFLSIVWHKNQDYTLDVKTAWEVAGIIWN